MKTAIEKLNIVFVKMIQKNPCIWDTASEDYRNKVMVRAAWDKISKVIDEPAENCPERWRKIRDALFRSIKRQSLKKPNRKGKPYYLTPYLQFILDPSIHSTTNTNEESHEDDEMTCSNFENDESKPGAFLKIPDDFQNNSEPELQAVEMINIDKCTKRNTSKQEHENHFDKTLEEDSDALNIHTSTFYDDIDENEDSDMNFFKSLLRDVRKMNDKQNRKFRLKVLQAIDEIFESESGDQK